MALIAANQPLIKELDALIARRDSSGDDVQDEIDLLLEQIENNAEADPEFQAEQAAAAWKRACINNQLWW